jgi:hypothetical protein
VPPATPPASPSDPKSDRRAFIAFRRKTDFFWFLLTFVLFGFCLAVLWLGVVPRKPEVVEVEKIRYVEKPVEKPTPVPASPKPADKNVAKARPAPPRTQAPGAAPQIREEILHLFKDEGVVADAGWKTQGTERALIITYDFSRGNWVVAGQGADPNFQNVDVIEFEVRSSGGKNTLEFKVEDEHGANIGQRWHGETGNPEWKKYKLRRDDLKYLWGGEKAELDWSKIKLIDFGVSHQETQGDEGGSGRVEIRRIHFR